ncbi:MAG TPA: hypothetical protein VD995_08635 [Azospirillum sp.]|nr:hypothetical protein [Azospirillum sp.]
MRISLVVAAARNLWVRPRWHHRSGRCPCPADPACGNRNLFPAPVTNEKWSAWRRALTHTEGEGLALFKKALHCFAVSFFTSVVMAGSAHADTMTVEACLQQKLNDLGPYYDYYQEYSFILPKVMQFLTSNGLSKNISPACTVTPIGQYTFNRWWLTYVYYYQNNDKTAEPRVIYCSDDSCSTY